MTLIVTLSVSSFTTTNDPSPNAPAGTSTRTHTRTVQRPAEEPRSQTENTSLHCPMGARSPCTVVSRVAHRMHSSSLATSHLNCTPLACPNMNGDSPLLPRRCSFTSRPTNSRFEGATTTTPSSSGATRTATVSSAYTSRFPEPSWLSATACTRTRDVPRAPARSMPAPRSSTPLPPSVDPPSEPDHPAPPPPSRPSTVTTDWLLLLKRRCAPVGGPPVARSVKLEPGKSVSHLGTARSAANTSTSTAAL